METRLHFHTRTPSVQIDTTLVSSRRQLLYHLRVCPGNGLDNSLAMHHLETNGYLLIADQRSVNIHVRRYLHFQWRQQVVKAVGNDLNGSIQASAA